MTSPSFNAKFIATHDGTFHCDEVTACFMLRQLPEFKDHDIVRTRDENILNSADIVVDVGGVFDSATKRFDHHQRSFQLTIKDFHANIKSTNPIKPIRLSSAGLVYAHYGKNFIQEVLRITSKDNHIDGDSICQANDTKHESMLDAVFEKFYGSFMEEIDAIDNGVEMVEGETFVYNYNLSTHLAARISRLNPRDGSPEDRLKQFHQAMSVVGPELIDCVQHLALSWWPALNSLKKCVLDRHNVDESGTIVEVPSDTSWRSSIFRIEEQLSIVGQIKYIIFNNPESTPGWRIMAVPISSKSFVSRLPLREEWRGLRDEDLCKIADIPDAGFVHATGFTGGAKSREGCLALAKKTLDMTGQSI